MPEDTAPAEQWHTRESMNELSERPAGTLLAVFHGS
jgi:hypothetical protein